MRLPDVSARAIAGLVFGAALAAAAASAQPATPRARPVGQALKVEPPFALDKKTRKSVSGIACMPDGRPQRCLVVFDEGTSAQFTALGRRSLRPLGAPFDLTGSGGELDAEGAAAADGYLYVTGSHAVKRKSCKPNPASRSVQRFQAGAPGDALQGQVTSARLWTLMTQEPYLARHLDACLGNGDGGLPEQMQHRPGVNIEGLAAAGGRLFFGFRGPSEDEAAPIFSVDARALFDGGDASPRLDRVRLGARKGIRDMAATADGALLLLVGPDDHDAGDGARWAVAEWRPSRVDGATPVPRLLATLDIRSTDIGKACSDALKPEALAILGQTAARYRVLVLSDGVCDGGLLLFDIPR